MNDEAARDALGTKQIQTAVKSGTDGEKPWFKQTQSSRRVAVALLFLGLTLFYLASVAFPQLTVMKSALAAVSLGLVLITLPVTPASDRRLPVILLVAGIVLLFFYGVPWRQWVYGVSYMADITVLVLVSPVIQLLFARRQYSKALVKTMSITSDLKMIVWSTISTHLLGIVTLVGAFPIVYEMMLARSNVMGKKRYDDVIARSMMQGFVLTNMWSPISANMAVALSLAGLRWVEILPYMVPVVAGGLLISIATQSVTLWFSRGKSRTNPAEAHDVSTQKTDDAPRSPLTREDVRRTVELFILLITFPTAVLLFETWTGWPILAAVPAVAVFIVVVGFYVTGEHGVGEELVRFFLYQIPAKFREILLFLAAGVAAFGFRESGMMRQLFQWINEMLGGDLSLILVILPLVIALVSVLGFPPLVIVVLVAASLDPTTLGLPAIVLLLAVTSGASFGLLFSPVAGPVMICSAMLSRKPIDVGLRSNWLYGLTLFIYIQTVLHLMNR